MLFWQIVIMMVLNGIIVEAWIDSWKEGDKD